jgi:uncharacterized repeat protein (TIGR03943 family)
MVRAAFIANAAAVLAILLTWRTFDGTIFYLVQSWYDSLLYATVTVLAVLACFAAWPLIKDTRRSPLHFDPKVALAAVLVCVPMVLLVAIPAKPLGSDSLARADANQDLSVGTSTGPARSEPASRNVFEWAVAFQTEPPEAIAGQPVDVVAFVYHPEGLAAGRFMAARFVVACCVADARGVALPVEWAGSADLKADAWVRVEGSVAQSSSGEPFVRATSVDYVDAPRNPYLYP